MHSLFHILVGVMIVGLFLYSKLLPFKDKLNPNYKRLFDFFSSLFRPIFSLLKGIFRPYSVGGGIGVDMTQIVVLILLLILFSL